MGWKVKSKPVSLATQQIWLKRLFPDSIVEIQNSILTWRGFLTPTVISPRYEILLVYSLNSPPEVFVLKPELTKNEAGKLPHVYSIEFQKLCLHFPPEKKWRTNKILAKIILPWVSDWLYFYETWVATKKWLGDGTHKEDKKYIDVHYRE